MTRAWMHAPSTHTAQAPMTEAATAVAEGKRMAPSYHAAARVEEASSIRDRCQGPTAAVY